MSVFRDLVRVSGLTSAIYLHTYKVLARYHNSLNYMAETCTHGTSRSAATGKENEQTNDLAPISRAIVVVITEVSTRRYIKIST